MRAKKFFLKHAKIEASSAKLNSFLTSVDDFAFLRNYGKHALRFIG